MLTYKRGVNSEFHLLSKISVTCGWWLFSWTEVDPHNLVENLMMEDLDALLTDLQNTTAVLKRANLSQQYAETEEPIYEPQRARTAMSAPSRGEIGLQDLEQLLDDYDEQRPSSGGGGKRAQQPDRSSGGGRPTVESLLGELDNAVVVENGEARRANPSSAGRDLDHLMASLSDFKPGVSDSYSRPQKNRPTQASGDQLDNMLGTLQSDMSKHGISTIPKGDCAACGKTIVGQVVIGLAKMWHPEHFVCVHCGEELGHRNFFERSGKAYCENDYHNLFSPRCAYCNGAIKDKCVTALDKTWHPEHFFCAQCGKDFGEDGFHEKDGRAFCRQDYFAMFAPRCKGCQRAIMNNYITALNTQWHPECFVCQSDKEFSKMGPVIMRLD